MPSDLLTRRADIQQAWLELLAADAGVAVAQKNRFPSLTLSANIQDNRDDDALNSLFNGQTPWTVAASLAQPLFQGGRLRAEQRQSEARLVQAEQRYLEVVHTAFAEVENELQRIATLAARLQAVEQSSANAEAALTLSESQYRRGLVPYTTVLESQRRAFDAQTSVVQLEQQLAQGVSRCTWLLVETTVS